MDNKGLAITVFVILGLLLVIMLSLFYRGYLDRQAAELQVEQEKQTSFAASRLGIQTYMEACIDRAYHLALDEVGLSNANLELFNSVVRGSIRACSLNLRESLEKQGFKVESEYLSTSTVLGDETAILYVHYPQKYVHDNEVFYFENFTKTYPFTKTILISGGVTTQETILTSTDSRAFIKIPEQTYISDGEGNPVENLEIKIIDRTEDGLKNPNMVGELIYNLKPEGVIFSNPVQIGISFDIDDVPDIEDAKNARIGWLDKSVNIWLMRPTKVECTLSECFASTYTLHGSKWAVMAGDCREGLPPYIVGGPGRIILSSYSSEGTTIVPRGEYQVNKGIGFWDGTLEGIYNQLDGNYYTEIDGDSPYWRADGWNYGPNYVRFDRVPDSDGLYPWKCRVFFGSEDPDWPDSTLLPGPPAVWRNVKMEKLACGTDGFIISDNNLKVVNHNPDYDGINPTNPGDIIRNIDLGRGYRPKNVEINKITPQTLGLCAVGEDGESVVPIHYISYRIVPKPTDKQCCCKLDTACFDIDDSSCWSECSVVDSCDEPEKEALDNVAHMESWNLCGPNKATGAWYYDVETNPVQVGEKIVSNCFYGEEKNTITPASASEIDECLDSPSLGYDLSINDFIKEKVKGYTHEICAGGSVVGTELNPLAKWYFATDGSACLNDDFLRGYPKFQEIISDPDLAQARAMRGEMLELIFEGKDNQPYLQLGSDILGTINLAGRITGCTECLESIGDPRQTAGCGYCSSSQTFTEEDGQLVAVLTEISVDNREREFNTPGFNIYTGGESSSESDLLAGIGNYQFEIYGNPSQSSRVCFVAGTKISAPYYEINIEDVRPGDIVWTFNVTSGKREARVVLETYVRQTNQIALLMLEDNNTIETTPDHPFFDGLSFKPISEFQKGDELFTYVDSQLKGVKITLIEIVNLTNYIDVYNLKVDGNYNYFANGILNHNIGYFQGNKNIFSTYSLCQSNYGVVYDFCVSQRCAGSEYSIIETKSSCINNCKTDICDQIFSGQMATIDQCMKSDSILSFCSACQFDSSGGCARPSEAEILSCRNNFCSKLSEWNVLGVPKEFLGIITAEDLEACRWGWANRFILLSLGLSNDDGVPNIPGCREYLSQSGYLDWQEGSEGDRAFNSDLLVQCSLSQINNNDLMYSSWYKDTHGDVCKMLADRVGVDVNNLKQCMREYIIFADPIRESGGAIIENIGAYLMQIDYFDGFGECTDIVSTIISSLMGRSQRDELSLENRLCAYLFDTRGTIRESEECLNFLVSSGRLNPIALEISSFEGLELFFNRWKTVLNQCIAFGGIFSDNPMGLSSEECGALGAMVVGDTLTFGAFTGFIDAQAKASKACGDVFDDIAKSQCIQARLEEFGYGTQVVLSAVGYVTPFVPYLSQGARIALVRSVPTRTLLEMGFDTEFIVKYGGISKVDDLFELGYTFRNFPKSSVNDIMRTWLRAGRTLDSFPPNVLKEMQGSWLVVLPDGQLALVEDLPFGLWAGENSPLNLNRASMIYVEQKRERDAIVYSWINMRENKGIVFGPKDLDKVMERAGSIPDTLDVLAHSTSLSDQGTVATIEWAGRENVNPEEFAEMLINSGILDAANIKTLNLNICGAGICEISTIPNSFAHKVQARLAELGYTVEINAPKGYLYSGIEIPGEPPLPIVSPVYINPIDMKNAVDNGNFFLISAEEAAKISHSDLIIIQANPTVPVPIIDPKEAWITIQP